MKTTTSGYEVFFGLVIEAEDNGERLQKIVDYCRPGEIPFIGVTIRKIDLRCQEYFEVKNEDGRLQPCKKSCNLWKFLSSKEVSITMLDEKEGIGYEFALSLHQNGSYTELQVSRSKLFASKCVSTEQLTNALIEAAEASKKRRTRPQSEAIQNLIQTLNTTVHASAVPITVPKNGNGKRQVAGGYFAELYREARNNPSLIY